MSLLYKNQKDIKIGVDINEEDENIRFLFHSDCGKFGSDEILAEFVLPPSRLLELLKDE